MMRAPAPLRSSKHGNLRLKRPASMGFAAQQAIVPVHVGELVYAAGEFLVAFIKTGSSTGLVAVVGNESGHNVFIGSDGKWLGRYVPERLRIYPFGLGQKPGEDSSFLIVDEECGLLSQTEGEPLFDASGQPTGPAKMVFDMVQSSARDRAATQAICQLLTEWDLFVPWEPTVWTAQGEARLTGLWRIDEVRFRALDDEKFLSLRQGKALNLIYAHLISLSRIRSVSQNAQWLQKLGERPRGPAKDTFQLDPDPKLEFSVNDTLIEFR